MADKETEPRKPPLKRSSYALLLFAVVVLSLGAAVGLLLHFLLPGTEVGVQRTDVVADCQPESLPEGDTEERCISRQYVQMTS